MFFDNDLFQNDLKKLCYVFFAAVGLIESESEARGKRRPASGPIVFKTICIFIYICICFFLAHCFQTNLDFCQSADVSKLISHPLPTLHCTQTNNQNLFAARFARQTRQSRHIHTKHCLDMASNSNYESFVNNRTFCICRFEGAIAVKQCQRIFVGADITSVVNV